MILSIVTLNYKKPQLTIGCITSLYEIHRNEFEINNFEIVIVDNDSQDKSVETINNHILKNKYKNVHIIANKHNTGFGAGNNLGAKKAKGTYVCFLNNDTLVKDTGLSGIVSYLDTNREITI